MIRNPFSQDSAFSQGSRLKGWLTDFSSEVLASPTDAPFSVLPFLLLLLILLEEKKKSQKGKGGKKKEEERGKERERERKKTTQPQTQPGLRPVRVGCFSRLPLNEPFLSGVFKAALPPPNLGAFTLQTRRPPPCGNLKANKLLGSCSDTHLGICFISCLCASDLPNKSSLWISVLSPSLCSLACQARLVPGAPALASFLAAEL